MSPMNHPTRHSVFLSGSTLPRHGAIYKQSESTIYRPMRRKVEDADLACDRCATDSVPMVGVIVDPAAQVVRVFCGPCYGRTRLARMTHREWRTFEATGHDRWTRELLTTVLTSAGLLDAGKADESHLSDRRADPVVYGAGLNRHASASVSIARRMRERRSAESGA